MPGPDKKRILIVEDDESISLGLRMNLEAEGYEVSVAEDGEAGLDRVRTGDPLDLVVLDVMLPRRNGIEVLRLLRSEGNSVPIIVLSARGAEMDKVLGLELGAEDYVTKPFGLAELLARVRAVLRRDAIARPRSEEIVRTADIEINAATHQVVKAGKVVPLTPTEFDILWCLVEAGGHVRSREQIKASVWGPGHHGTPRTIDNFLAQLRAKLEPDPSEPRHLLTVRGVGYRFQM
ncbi:MAG TPA: response regulator transcription factor [Polyangiaceae bacterium]|nr:response regulator transcription factor [Polyangiaceae bacterium]